MLRGRGALLLFADADGATEVSDYNRLEAALFKELAAHAHAPASSGKRRL